MIRKVFSRDMREKINGFFAKPAYIIALTVLTAISFALELEPVLYTVFALVAVLTAFCASDLLPVMPLLALGYVATSTDNNPGRNPNSVFSGATGVYIICLAVVIVAVLLYRVIRERKRLFRKNGQLLTGLILLTVAYVLSGIGFPGYGNIAWKNIPYGLIQGLALLLPYWLLTGGVDWEKHRKDYFAWLGVCMGSLLVFEVLWIYFAQSVIVNGVIVRNLIYTGWGMYNNLGNMLTVMIPFAFWMGIYYRKRWLGYLVGLVFLAGVFLTCSRSSMIFAVLCYGCCSLLAPDEKYRELTGWIVVLVTIFSGLLLIIFRDTIFSVFNHILDNVNELHSRFAIYSDGFREFLKNPVFGGSFYPASGLSYSWAQTDITNIMPARWHNTLIQLLASTGLVGLAAYSFHRYQTIRLAIKCKNPLQVLMIFSALVVLVGSMTDCHMFNVGPGMFYAMTLAWLEKKSELVI